MKSEEKKSVDARTTIECVRSEKITRRCAERRWRFDAHTLAMRCRRIAARGAHADPNAQPEGRSASGVGLLAKALLLTGKSDGRHVQDVKDSC